MFNVKTAAQNIAAKLAIFAAMQKNKWIPAAFISLAALATFAVLAPAAQAQRPNVPKIPPVTSRVSFLIDNANSMRVEPLNISPITTLEAENVLMKALGASPQVKKPVRIKYGNGYEQVTMFLPANGGLPAKATVTLDPKGHVTRFYATDTVNGGVRMIGYDSNGKPSFMSRVGSKVRQSIANLAEVASVLPEGVVFKKDAVAKSFPLASLPNRELPQSLAINLETILKSLTPRRAEVASAPSAAASFGKVPTFRDMADKSNASYVPKHLGKLQRLVLNTDGYTYTVYSP